MTIKRKVGRPTKAEALARSLARAKAEGRGDIGTKLRLNLKRKDDLPVSTTATTAPDHSTTLEHRRKRTKQQEQEQRQQSYHPEKRKYHKKTPEERAAIVAKDKRNFARNHSKKTWRPTRKEAKLRAQESRTKTTYTTYISCYVDLVDHAWDAEIAAIKDGAPYGTSPEDCLLPNIRCFGNVILGVFLINKTLEKN